MGYFNHHFRTKNNNSKVGELPDKMIPCSVCDSCLFWLSLRQKHAVHTPTHTPTHTPHTHTHTHTHTHIWTLCNYMLIHVASQLTQFATCEFINTVWSLQLIPLPQAQFHESTTKDKLYADVWRTKRIRVVMNGASKLQAVRRKWWMVLVNCRR